MAGTGAAMPSSACMVDDLHQGVLPAVPPFVDADRGYSCAAVAGLTLAAMPEPAAAGTGSRRTGFRCRVTAGQHAANRDN